MTYNPQDWKVWYNMDPEPTEEQLAEYTPLQKDLIKKYQAQWVREQEYWDLEEEFEFAVAPFQLNYRWYISQGDSNPFWSAVQEIKREHLIEDEEVSALCRVLGRHTAGEQPQGVPGETYRTAAFRYFLNDRIFKTHEYQRRYELGLGLKDKLPKEPGQVKR